MRNTTRNIHRAAAIYHVVLGVCIISVSIPVAQGASHNSTLIKAARLLDVRTGQELTDQAILVQEDKIVEVGPASVVTAHAPTTARVLDLGGLTILPGLVDCHAHVLGDLKDLSPFQTLGMSSAMATVWGVHNLQQWLDHGFTTLRDAGESDLGYGQLALRDGIRMGLIKGPRMVSAGNFISVTGGHGDSDALAPDQALPRRPNIADNVEEIGPAVRHDIKYGADWIKVMATGGISDLMSDFGALELSQEQMERAVEIAHRARHNVMAHAEGTEGIRAAVRAGVDSIEHGTMLDEEGAALMAQNGTWLVPTLEVIQRYNQPGRKGVDPVVLEKSSRIIQFQDAAFRLALIHQVKIAFGLDDEPEFLPDEFSAMVRGGMKPIEALQAATLRAAELLGLSDQLGTLERGKIADLVAVSGDPLKDVGAMNNVVFVMHDGDVVKDDRNVKK